MSDDRSAHLWLGAPDQPTLAGRPWRSRYRATRSLIVATNAFSSLLVGALTR